MHNISNEHASRGTFGTCSLAPKLPDLPKDLQVAEADALIPAAIWLRASSVLVFAVDYKLAPSRFEYI
jgi:hypothetical protein